MARRGNLDVLTDRSSHSRTKAHASAGSKDKRARSFMGALLMGLRAHAGAMWLSVCAGGERGGGDVSRVHSRAYHKGEQYAGQGLEVSFGGALGSSHLMMKGAGGPRQA